MQKNKINKVISFCVPCYNSAEYMDHCIENLIKLNNENNDVEIIIVDDGSTKDFTYEIAKGWEFKYPELIKAVHQKNGGHGQAVNTGLKEASGLYFKVVDSDDWLDVENTKPVMKYLRSQMSRGHKNATDLVLANYVYNKVSAGEMKPINYENCMPEEVEFSWNLMGTTRPSQYILMHSAIYRTKLLKDIDLELPKHTFYVDNIFVYVPLPYVKSIYYISTNMYMYFIGREDQSVNEDIMMSRIDQQIKITKIMIDKTNLELINNFPQLKKYMISYLAMMMCICSVFLRKKETKEDTKKLDELWLYLKEHDKILYNEVKNKIVCRFTNIPGSLGKFISETGYSIAQRLYGFN